MDIFSAHILLGSWEGLINPGRKRTIPRRVIQSKRYGQHPQSQAPLPTGLRLIPSGTW